MITPQLVDVIDLFSAQRISPSGHRQQLTTCQVERWGLALECPILEDPTFESEISWLFTDLGLRLTQRRPRSRHARRGPSVLTAVYIERDTRSWSTTDLLLGLEVPDQGAPRLVQAEEFAAAVSGGVIRASEAEYALRTVHRTFEQFSLHHDLGQWLTHRGIFDTWPR